MRVTVAPSLRLLARVSGAVTLAAVVLLVLAGISRTDSSAEQLQRDAVAAELLAAEIQSSPAIDEPTPAAIREAPSAGLVLQQYLDERYGPAGAQADWHGSIRRVAVRFGTAVIQSDLEDGPESSEAAAAIVQAALGFHDTVWGRQTSGLAVEVLGQRGQILAQERVPPPPTPSPALMTLALMP
jgi:hypothetical protein